MITSMLSNDLAYAFAWTLIHSIWQFTLVAILLALVLKITQNSRATIRYFIGFGALGISLIMALVTFAIYYVDTSTYGQSVSSVQNYQLLMLEVGASSTMTTFLNFIDTYLLAIVNAWLIGSILFFLKFTSAYIYLRKIVHRSIPANKSLTKSLSKFKNKFEIYREVAIKESKEIATPLVMGYIKPVILFPLGLINQLSTEEVNAILAHELAHIKRHDYLFNILQIITEVVFYYHPAIWFISSRIRIERENCCDDMAIEYTGNNINYAKTLVKLQEINSINVQPAMAFTGNQKLFTNRIMRILNQPNRSSSQRDKILAALLLFTTIFLGAKNYHSDNAKVEDNYDVYVIDDCPQSPEDIKYYLDTIPERNTFHIKKRTDKKNLEMEMENGQITKLKIDGEEIPQGELSEHNDVIQELMPNEERDIITLFPECGDDFGKVYLLDRKNRKAVKMDSIFSVLSEREEGLANLRKMKLRNFDFNTFEDFDDIMIDTIKEEVRVYALDNNIFDRDQNIFIDSIWDLFPHKMPTLLLEKNKDLSEKNAKKLEKILKDKNSWQEHNNDWLFEKDVNDQVLELRDRIDGNLFKEEHEEMLEKIEKERLVLRNAFPRNMNDRNDEVFRLYQDKLDRDFYIVNGKDDNVFSRKSNKISDVLTQQLLDDGLIDHEGNTKIELSGKFLKIDGDKQPKNIWKKYKKIYEKHTGLELTKDSKIKLEILSTDKAHYGESLF